MIVIGVDVHKQSVTAVAVDEAGRMLDERTVAVGSTELIGWAARLDAERLWALEDCRLLTPWLERQLLGRGEELVRVSPKLTVPERRAGRVRGKSDPIDALAVARAALREPDLPRPQPGEQVYREVKLLVDHRDDLVDERRRTQQRLRWHLFELDPTLVVPLRMLGRASHLERVSRWLARRDPELQVRIARELVSRCRASRRRRRARTPRAARLRCCDRGEVARRDRPDQPLQNRRTVGTPQRRRTARGELRQKPAPPTRPRRQPATERRALQDRDHAVPLPRRRTGLPRTQTS
jgi:transposase